MWYSYDLLSEPKGPVPGLPRVGLQEARRVVDWVEVGIVVVLVGLECVFDAIVVAWAAGRRSKKALVAYLESAESEPLWEKQTETIMGKLEPRIQEVEAKIPIGDVQLDSQSLVDTVSASLMPQVRAEIEKVRAMIDGKLGFARKVAKGTGEAVAEAIGERALQEAGVNPAEAELYSYLDGLLEDKAWAKAHPGAAIGLRLIKRETAGAVPGMGRAQATYSPGLKGRR